MYWNIIVYTLIEIERHKSTRCKYRTIIEDFISRRHGRDDSRQLLMDYRLSMELLEDTAYTFSVMLFEVNFFFGGLWVGGWCPVSCICPICSMCLLCPGDDSLKVLWCDDERCCWGA